MVLLRNITYIFGLTLLYTLLTGCLPNYHKIDFLKKPCFKPFRNYTYSLCSEMDVKVDEKTVKVPAGFKTDLASIPKILWPIIAPHKASMVYPAILHDYQYSFPGNISRQEADDVYYYAMLEEGNSMEEAAGLYFGARFFGKTFFNGKKNA